MNTLSDHGGGCTVAADINPCSIYAYFDTIRVWLQQSLSPRNLKWLEKHCALEVDKHAPFGFRYRQWLQLQQPMTDQVLPFLATLDGSHLNYLELGLDWTFNQQADRAGRFVDRHIIKKWHGNQRVEYDKTTRYSARRGAPNRIVNYADKPCRITGESECVHVEWRITGAGALRRAGISSVRDLPDFDHHRFWQQRLIMRAVNARALGRMVRTHAGKERRHAADLRAGQMLIASLGSTQNVVDHFHGQFDVGRCLVDINVKHLLPVTIL